MAENEGNRFARCQTDLKLIGMCHRVISREWFYFLFISPDVIYATNDINGGYLCHLLVIYFDRQTPTVLVNEYIVQHDLFAFCKKKFVSRSLPV